MNEMPKPLSDQRHPKAGATRPAHPNPWLKLGLEIGPLALFFFANARPQLFHPLVAPFLPPALLAGEQAGLFTATLVLIVAVLVALVISYAMTRRIPAVPLITAALAIAFGALTLYLHDATFIKMKPTILYICFSAALLIGMAIGRPVLPILFDHAMSLSERGWRLLTWRWAGFFLVLAGLNEIVWRTQSTDVWVAFKFPGLFILVLLFTFAQLPFIMRNRLDEEEAAKAPEHF
ncbi:Intracellular septation protein A [Methylocella silvestris BL2]|uniref:Inner membrane-spanning protein YciB n=1 Tax=Methylocella silvestris (strain DSM 15510 / CIP 108128 / LMG 27833 / NCIMB 13906 / BL2) TaxID=395965 RepID=B8EMC4_METSB|nr:septation protein A [Methylocella silvestris]ACK52052.1 Intracellular septation protein A [Methylocella silvestris BL2]